MQCPRSGYLLSVASPAAGEPGIRGHSSEAVHTGGPPSSDPGCPWCCEWPHAHPHPPTAGAGHSTWLYGQSLHRCTSLQTLPLCSYFTHALNYPPQKIRCSALSCLNALSKLPRHLVSQHTWLCMFAVSVHRSTALFSYYMGQFVCMCPSVWWYLVL